jgi:hypothetical protein
MAQARNREAWNHTAVMLATIINLYRPKGKKPVKAEELNPYAKRKRNSNAMTINKQEAQEIFREIAKQTR